MKPNFALSLSVEGIRLLRRVASGWRQIGEIGLASEDMAGELAVLRKTAASLEPGGVRTKLLIPNDQIKYLTISTPGLSDAARMRAAEHALDGATPYAVDDLAFDISRDGQKTHVAAVARETLAEAESFAIEHRFHPVSFAALPETEHFTGEPFFGATEISASLLEPGEEIERDEIAIFILGDAVQGEAVQGEAVDEALGESPPAPMIKEPEEKVAAKNAPATEKKTEELTGISALQAALETANTADPLSVPPSTGASKDTAEKEKAKAKEPAKEKMADGPTPTSDTLLDTKPKSEAKPAPTAFSSRRSTAPAVGSASRLAPNSALPTTGPIAAAAALTPDSSSLTPSAPVADKESDSSEFLSRRTPVNTPLAAPAETAAKASDTGRVTPNAASEAEQMTVFGERASSSIGGKPRYLGLLLTAALLLFLIGVAAWASVFLDDGISLSRLFGKGDTSAVAATPLEIPSPEITAPPMPAKAPADVAQQPKELIVAALDPTLSDEDGAVLDALRTPELTQPRELTRQDIEAKYATTGIWALAPDDPVAPAMISLEDLYLTSIDPVSTANDAIALPALASFSSDTFDFTPLSPVRPGTSFALDDRGLVIPDPSGAINPDGVLVYAGRPPIVPPQAPTRFTTEPVATPESAQITMVRPASRPVDLIEKNERSNLDGLTRAELARLRPELRPASMQQLAASTAAPKVDAATAAAAASLASPQRQGSLISPVSTINNATAFAVKASVRPDTRPKNFARIVKRAERIEEKATQVASAAAVAPRTVTPSMPSKASVAKQATVKNAIKLRDINLIGVYGKPSSRRALIRLSNGRYQKVAVGDKLDGGRVSAIGDSELRYTRRGRDVVLKMPRG